jgi:hypothetical protein
MTIHMHKYNHPDSDYDLSRKLDEVKREIKREWESYKQSRLTLHGEETQDTRLDMLLVFLIERGFFDE